MAWKSSTGGDLEWDSLVDGLQWFRRRESGGYKYLYLIFGDVPETLQAAAEKMEWGPDAEHFYNVKTAAEWATWEQASAFWTSELARDEEEEKKATLAVSVASTDPVQVEDDVDSPAHEVEDPVPTQAEDVQAVRLPDPRLESARPAYYAQRGAYSWPVKILVQPHDEISWVIQKVQTDGPDGIETFWEAFPVLPGKSEAEFQDIYMNGVSKEQRGSNSVRGLMQHFVFGAGEDPPGMTAGGSEGADREGFSTTTLPGFWQDSGTPHNLDVTWGALGTQITTVPESEPPLKKAVNEL